MLRFGMSHLSCSCLTLFYILQLKTAPFAILGAFVTIIVASIIPALRGANMEQNGAGPFTKVRMCISVSMSSGCNFQDWKALCSIPCLKEGVLSVSAESGFGGMQTLNLFCAAGAI